MCVCLSLFLYNLMSFVVSTFFPLQFNLFMFLQNWWPSVNRSVWAHRWSHLLTILCHQQRYIVIGNRVLKLQSINPISLQRAWHKRFQFLCNWALWWSRSSLRLHTRGMSDLGTVPVLLFGLLHSNLWSHCLCAELWLNIGPFSVVTLAQSQSRECLYRRGESRCETRTFSLSWKGFSVLIPARVPL